MSRYINWQNVVDKYVTAAKISGSAELKSNYVDAAEEEIDAALSGLYTVPFTPVPGMVKDLVVDLTYYKATYAQEHADKLKKYIDDRILRLQQRSLILTTSGQFIAPNNFAGYVNYVFVDGNEYGCGDPSECSRKHCL